MKSVLTAALLCAALTSARAQDAYRLYWNARFGTTLQIPTNLIAQRAPDNNDGRKFVSRDGAVELTVYAAHNVFGRSLRDASARSLRDWKSEGARLTFQKSGPNWFALSGYLGDDIFYEKTLLRNGDFHTLIWQYPRARRAQLDAAVTRSVRTFHVGGSFEHPAPLPAPTALPRPRRAPTAPPRPRRTPPASPSRASGY